MLLRDIWKYERKWNCFVSQSPLLLWDFSLTGVSYYLGTILTQAGVTDTTTQLEINIYLSVWCLFTSVLGTSLADRIGRKRLGAGSLSISLVFLYLVGAFTKCTCNTFI